ncbi:MAG: hypothetical protein AB7I59_21360 [Geminicoccaceae bacterium]
MRTYPLGRRDRPPCGDEFRSAVAASLRDLPTDTLHRLACRWPRRGDPAERIVAEVIDKELLHRPARTSAASGAVSTARASVAD